MNDPIVQRNQAEFKSRLCGADDRRRASRFPIQFVLPTTRGPNFRGTKVPHSSAAFLPRGHRRITIRRLRLRFCAPESVTKWRS